MRQESMTEETDRQILKEVIQSMLRDKQICFKEKNTEVGGSRKVENSLI